MPGAWRYFYLSVAVAVGTWLAAASAHAQTWVGGNAGDPHEWNENANWTPATIPTVTATFGPVANTTSVANDAGAVTIGTVNFTVAALAYAFAIDNAFTVNVNGVVNNSANTETFNIASGKTLTAQNSSSASGGTGAVQYNNAGGNMVFNTTSTAGSANVFSSFNGSNATVTFNNMSSAGSATFTSNPANFPIYTFNNSSTGGNAHFTLVDATVTFNNSSTAGSAIFTMPNVMHPGSITFHNTSSAGNANITNVGTDTLGSSVTFFDASTAGNATITNNINPSVSNAGGVLIFGNRSGGGTDTADAGTATITNNQFGSTSFFGLTSGANATIINNSGGTTTFEENSTAANAHITNNNGGNLTFAFGAATAGNAVIVNNVGGTVEFGIAGLLPFIVDTATAGNATITNSGSVEFSSATTAGNVQITNNNGGLVSFGENSTAANAVIANAGTVTFFGSSTAASASITNNAGGQLSFGAFTETFPGGTTLFNPFIGTGSAGNAIIINNNGGSTTFFNQSTAGTATITNNAGGALFFANTGGSPVDPDASTARVTNNAGGTVDISQVNAGVSIGSLSGAGNVFLGSKVLTLGNLNGNDTIGGVIADGGMGGGSGGELIKIGTGMLILTGTNTYTGGTTISGGVLQLGNGGTGGSVLGNITDNAVLAVNRSDVFTLSNLITGTGAFQQLGTGTTIMTANNTYTGGTTISAGTLQLGNGGTSGAVLGNITDNAILAVNRSDVFTLSNLITGTGAFVQLGTGTTVLTANNTYTGGTTISAGTLQLGNGGTSGAVLGNITDNAILAVNRSDVFTLSNLITGTGAFQQLGTGTTIMTANNTYTGGTTISAGMLQLGNGGTSGSVLGNITDNAALAVNRSDVVTLGNLITGTGAFGQLGTGTTILTANNTYTGGTLIGAGTLQLGNGGTSGSVLGNIVDNAVLAVNRSDVFTLSNLITGSGAFQQLGTGTTIMTANNTYTGGTTIGAGILELGNGGSSGSVLGNITDNAVLAVNRSDVFILSNVITGTGAFQQLGPGATILTATDTYTGATFVNAGALVVDGSIATSSSVTVNSGGTLAGTGTVATTVVNAGGMLAPGDGNVGTLTVKGNLTFNADSTFMVFVTPTTSSSVNVTGSASLAGTVEAVFLPGSYLTNAYTILTATGGRTGTFDNLVTVDLPAFLTAKLTYDPNDVMLMTLTSNLNRPGLTQNQSAVAAALDNSFNTGHGTLNGLSFVTANQLPAALNALSGEGASGTQETSLGAGDLFLSSMMEQGQFWRSGTGATGTTYAPLGYAGDPSQAPVFKAMPLKAPLVTEPVYRAWFAGFDGTWHLDGEAGPGSATLRQSTAGGAAGLDYQVNPNLLVGVAAGGSSSAFSVPDRATSGTLDGAHVGTYGVGRWGPWYAAGALAFNAFDNNYTRTIAGVGPTELATGKFESNMLSGRFELGYRQIFSGFALTPFAAVEFAELWQPGYSETSNTLTGAPGVLGLTYSAQTVSSLPTFLGAQFDTRVTLANGTVWLPYARLSWVHEFDSARDVNAGFITLPATNFTVFGPSAARDAARVDVGSKFAVTRQAALFASFEGEFSDRSQMYAGKGGLKITW